jgi:phospholipase C
MTSEDSSLSRREFLERTAYAAGLAGAAATLPAGVLLSQAAKAQASPLPSPRNVPIDHFVILMMENRSFDHYFGWLSDVADGDQTQNFVNHTGADVWGVPPGGSVPTHHAGEMSAQWQGCGFGDPGHGWDAGRAQLQDGFLAAGAGNDDLALAYYNDGDLGFIQPAAKAYTLYDQYFCSLLGPTWPNRYYKWSAQSGGVIDNNPPVPSGGNQWETIFDRALRNNPSNTPGPGAITCRYYNSDLPFSAVWGPRAVPWTHPIAQYYADCAAGTLPNITIVDPPFRDGGGGDGLSADEHPLGDVRLGQAFMSDVVHAFMDSPNYERGALFIIYDEWGGFFDHVTPPKVPDDRESVILDDDFGQMGFRTPAVTVSPYTRKTGPETARVSHTQLGHESIIKLITYRFGLGDLVTRDAMANNIGDSFDWDSTDFEPPDLPDPMQVASVLCSLGGDPSRTATSIHDHESDLADLEALADRFGFKTGDGKPEDIFQQPDSVKHAVDEGDRVAKRRHRKKRHKAGAKR